MNPSYPDDCPFPQFDPMLTGNCNLISHKQKMEWLRWLEEKEAFAKKGRKEFEDIPQAFIVTLYDKEIQLISDMHSFVSDLPINNR